MKKKVLQFFWQHPLSKKRRMCLCIAIFAFGVLQSQELDATRKNKNGNKDSYPTENASNIYVSEGATLVGSESIGHGKIVKLVTKKETVKKQIVSKKRQEKDVVGKISDTVSYTVSNSKLVIFYKIPLSSELFSTADSRLVHAVPTTNNLVVGALVSRFYNEVEHQFGYTTKNETEYHISFNGNLYKLTHSIRPPPAIIIYSS